MTCRTKDANVRMIMNNIADSATITATPDFASIIGLENSTEGAGMQRQEGAFVARTSGLPSVQQIFVDLQSPRTMAYDAWVLYGTFSETATIVYKFYAGTGQTGDLLLESPVPENIYLTRSCLDTSCAIECGDSVISTQDAPISASIPIYDKLKLYGLTENAFEKYQSLLIEIRDPDNAAGYFDISRIFGGFMFRPTYNANYPFAFEPQTSTTQVNTAGGGVISFVEANWRQLSFELQLMGDVESTTFYNEVLRANLANDIFIDFKPSAIGSEKQLFAFRAKFLQLPRMTGNGLDRNTWAVSLREVK